MPFVKLDCEIRSSSLWMDCPPEARLVFITMLTMAEPFVLEEPASSSQSILYSPRAGWCPQAEYGMTRATSPAITRESNLPRADVESALRILESPDHKSRSQAFEGRRVARVDGGYLVLNYAAYRERDYTAAARMRRHRAKKKAHCNGVTRNVTPSYASQKSEVITPLTPQTGGRARLVGAQLNREALSKLEQIASHKGCMPEEILSERARQSGWKGGIQPNVAQPLRRCFLSAPRTPARAPSGDRAGTRPTRREGF